MADNVTVDNVDLTDYVVATDDDGTAQHQYVKLEYGADGTFTKVAAGANALPVQGTVTAVASGDHTVIGKAADGAAVSGNPVLIAGQDGTNAQSIKTDSDGELQVDVLSVAGSVAVTNAGLTELAAAIDTEVQVDVVGALPAGNNNIGDVDVASVVPGTGATNLGKAEDGPHTTGDVGVMALGVRQSSQADFGADGDYVPISVDDDGGVRVSIVAGAGSGGTASADDADFSAGTTSGTPAMGVFESSPTSVTDGDMGIVGITAARQLKVTEANSATIAGHVDGIEGLLTTIDADTGGILTSVQTLDNAISGSEMQVDVVAALPAGTNNIGDVDIASIAAGDNNIGNVDIVTMPTVTVNAHAVTNAGTFAVQESGAALTALQLIDNPVVVDDAAFTPATTSVMMAGFEFDDSTPDSVNEGDAGAARMSANRNVYTTLRDAAGNERGANVNASSQLEVAVGNTVTVGSHAVTNAGTFATQVDGAALTALQVIDNPILVDDAAFTPATSSVNMAGFQADEASIDSVDEGDAGAARMTLDRKVIVTNQPHSAGGCSIFRSLDIDETEEDVKTSAGTVYGWYIANLATTTRFVKFYNLTAANTTVGSSTPVLTLPVPGNATDDVAANLLGGVGINFDTAICVAATTGVADADTGAPGTNDVVVNVFYK